FTLALNKTDIQQDSSLQNVLDLLQDTLAKYKDISFLEVQNNVITEWKRIELIYTTTDAFQTFALKYGWYHLNESTPVLRRKYERIRVRIRKRLRRDFDDDFHLGESSSETVNIPSENFKRNGSVIVVIRYKDLHELLRRRELNNADLRKRRRLNSLVMAVAMDPKPRRLMRNVVMRFRNQKLLDATRNCVYWKVFDSKSIDGWSDEGCQVSKRKPEYTECSCNHLTHFAVLFDFGSASAEVMMFTTEKDEKILTILTYVGLILSLIGIILTLASYALLTDVHQPLSQVRLSLVASLGLGQIMFLAGINATQDKGVCVAVAALMQYFLMSAFCWMLVEGIYLYLFVVKVYNINEKMAVYHACSWAFPAVMVSISLIISSARDEISSFVSEEYCWLSNANHSIWIFAVFVVTVEVLNLLILARVVKEMSGTQSAPENHQIRLCIKTCVVMIPLLGVTWLFGIFSTFHKAFAYIFTIFNSNEGFLIFLLHCVRNSQVSTSRFIHRLN
ncbi:unnamed protein product, partial [Pocillopora meandrina]